MFINYTNLFIFDFFEKEYKDKLILFYPQIIDYKINCYSFESYKQLINVPQFEDFQNDCFGFAYDDSEIENKFFAIVFSEINCQNLNFSKEDYLASIAHELGHLILAPILNGKSIWYQEIKADEVAIQLNLSTELKCLLKKLRDSNLYTLEQNALFDMRIKYINLFKT